MNPFDVIVAVVLGGVGVSLAVVLAVDGGTVVEILLVLLVFGTMVLRWIAYARGWQGLWRR